VPELSLNLPINSVSFGQVSTLILRELYKRGLEPCSLFPIGEVDFSTQEKDDDFFEWVQKCVSKRNFSHSRKNPTLKLWHLNGSMESYSENNSLLTFYELDSPTKSEINIAKNNKNLIVTSNYSKEIFKEHGVDAKVIPLAFDDYNFKRKEKKYFEDGRVNFTICGKFEKRKNHAKTIASWAKRFGNNKKYFLQCSVYNNFAKEELNKKWFSESVLNKNYFNVQFLGHMPHNNLYNDYLNSSDIVLCMSGAEGWGLPEFHSVAMGAHAVVLNATAYKEWANKENSVLIEPTEKIECYDGIFFNKGSEFNQGNIYDYNEDEFIHACEEAIRRHEENPRNLEGEKIVSEFTPKSMVDSLLDIVLD